MKNSQVSAICGLCASGCHVKVRIKDEKILDVAADLDSPYGYVCPKGKIAPKIVHSPDRIINPLIRNGEKGTVGFRQASWAEAMDLIGQGLIRVKEKYGATAVASYLGAGTLEDSLREFGSKFLSPFGSPNDMDCGSICYVASRIIAPLTTLGLGGSNLVADYDNAEAIIIWGANPAKDFPPIRYRKIKEAKKRGAIVIVIDPRRHQLAISADYWIPIRPGTDGALILGVLNIIIQNGRYDRNFIENMTIGFEELKAYAKNFTPSKVADICRIDEQLIFRLAEIMTSKKGVALSTYTGFEYAASGVQNTRALYILWAITGNIDIKGGLYIDQYPYDTVVEYPIPENNAPIGAREHSVFYALTGKAQFVEFPKAVLHDDPYPARALVVIGGSPYLSYPQPELWREVFKRLDFLVVVDRFMTMESIWADVILPAATYYEITSFQYYRSFKCYQDRVFLRRKVIEPVGEARNDVLIVGEIAKRLGYGNLYPQNEDEILKKVFENQPDLLKELLSNPGGVRLEECERRYKKYESGHLRSDEKPGFPTPSGKLEICSSILAKYGYDPLPVYADPYDGLSKTKKSSEKYPFALTTGARSVYKFNSQYLNIPDLVRLHPVPVLALNPVDASAIGVKDGDRIWVETENGKLRLTASITSDICAGTVHAPYGGGSIFQKGEWKEAAINILLSPQGRDPISGYITCKAIPCNIRKELPS